MTKVRDLFPGRDPIAQFVRIGRDHHQMEELLTGERFPVERAVFRAGLVPRQTEFLAELQKRAETVLDPGIAELASIGRFEGLPSRAPWAADGRPLQAKDLLDRETLAKIARFAIEHHFNAVLSPTRYHERITEDDLNVDLKACQLLRDALDREGGATISIDYRLSTAHRALKDRDQVAIVLRQLAGAPTENLWLHISPFGVDATAGIVRRLIETIARLEPLNAPIVVDGVAGLPAFALLAFGAAGGIAHGVTEQERFEGNAYHKQPRKSSGGSTPARALVAGLDRQLTRQQYDTIANAVGGRALIACTDRQCCRNGTADTWENPKAHYLRQRRLPIEAMANIPNLRRASHFIDVDLRNAEKKVNAFSRLKISEANVEKIIREQQRRVDNFAPTLTIVQETQVLQRRSRVPQLRVNPVVQSQRGAR